MNEGELLEPELDAARRHFELFETLAADQGGWFMLCGIAEDSNTGKEVIKSRPIENKHTKRGGPAALLMNAAQSLADEDERKFNIYLSPCLLKSKPQGESRGKQTDVLNALAIPQDFDGGKGGEHLKQCPVPPHYIVETSTGNLQCWWIPNRPLEPKEEAEPIMAALTRACGEGAEKQDQPDHCSATLHQVMRVPGFVNWPKASKRKTGRVPELATIYQPYEGECIRVEDLQRLCERYPKNSGSSVTTSDTRPEPAVAEWTTGPVTGAAPIEDDGALIAMLRNRRLSAEAAFGKEEKVKASFSDLQDCKENVLADAYPATGGYNESSADFALANHYLWATGGDCERTESLMRRSALVREKWDEHRPRGGTYLRHTILTALDDCTKFYTGGGGHDDNEVPGWVTKVNEEYAVVLEQGEALIYQFEDGIPTNAMSFHSFRHWFANKRTPANNSGNTRKIGDAWLDHPKRKEYKKVIFKPNATPAEGVLNLWDDFAIKPAPGDWSLIDAHIRDVVCGGSQALHSYVLGWLARMVQYPDLVGEVALVMRGGQGTGKGVLGRCVGRIMGRHTLLAGSPEHLVGKFDGQLRNKCFVFCDEAHFPGDPRQKRKLRNLITEPEITIEPKFKTPIPVDNFMHMMMAGNDDWLVPADIDDRRFCVLDVSAHQRGHASYFDALCNQMGIDREKRTDGLAAMLHDLLEIDISDFNVRKVPQTAGLIDQKLHGLTGPKRWLANCLQQGRIAGREWGDEPLEIEKSVVFSDYEMWSGSRKSGEFKTEMWGTWSREIRNMLPGAIHDRRIGKDGSRVRCWCFDPLPQARDAFDSVLGGPTRWDDGCGADSENEEKGCDIFS